MPIIHPAKPIDIECTPGTYLVYKCEIEGLVSPLIFNIDYVDEAEILKANLQIFLSCTSRAPKKENNELMFVRQRSFKVHAEDVGKKHVDKEASDGAPKKQKKEAKNTMFSDRYLYIGLHSVSGCSLSLQFVQSKLSHKTLAQRRLEALKLKRAQAEQDIE